MIRGWPKWSGGWELQTHCPLKAGSTHMCRAHPGKLWPLADSFLVPRLTPWPLPSAWDFCPRAAPLLSSISYKFSEQLRVSCGCGPLPGPEYLGIWTLQWSSQCQWGWWCSCWLCQVGSRWVRGGHCTRSAWQVWQLVTPPSSARQWPGNPPPPPRDPLLCGSVENQYCRELQKAVCRGRPAQVERPIFLLYSDL